jgi:two-component system, OmpR family, response regulator
MAEPDAPSHRVLVVDDEPNIVDVVSMALRYQGFEVASAGTGREALAAVARFRPELMVLDVMLPDMEGFEVAERLGAQRGHIPIIFLTARDATQDKLRGLTTGGDDYVTKPFSLEELIARIRVILRRTNGAGPGAGKLVFEDLELDEDTREVVRGGELVELTVTEYRLLRYLMLNPRRVLTRAQILDHVWEYDFNGDARVLETYISYLRKKLDRHGRR